MRPMTEQQQETLRQQVSAVRSALSALRLTGLEDENVSVAKARLEDWLEENDGRWVVTYSGEDGDIEDGSGEDYIKACDNHKAS